MKNIFAILLPARHLLFILLTAGGLTPAFTFAQTQESEKGIYFERGTFSEILAKAKKENKMVMVDAYTTWCGPCKWMVKNIFPNDTVGEFYNKNFVNAKIDMEKGEGIDLAKKYNVSCYPTYLFMDADGQLLHRVSSTMQIKQFIELGTNAMNPAKQFAMYQKKYNSGTISTDELAEYILMRGRSCMSVKDEMEKYFATQKETDLTNQRNWDILTNHITDLGQDSREFNYLTSHRDDYAKIYRPSLVDTMIMSAYNFALYNHIKDKNYDAYNKLRSEVAKKTSPAQQESLANMDMILYKSKKEWSNYARAASAYIENYKKEDFNTLNNIAWDFYENIEDKTLLVKAEGWAKRAVELKSDYYNLDTYASLLFKLGKKTDAKATAEKAIESGKKAGEDITVTQELLDKINAMK
ncbi:MAG: DUF255 domain-containing protein [Bacteroidetes bacterium]|nr:MAG: DUF255 domain-containing protein [Bacteroidota bacterium]